MTAEEYLISYRDLEFKIKSLEDTLEDIRSALGIRGISFESDGSFTVSKNVHSREMQLAELSTFTDEVIKAKAELVKKKREIVEFIYTLQNVDERYVLYYRYIKRYSYDLIAEMLDYSVENIYRLRRVGLEKLNESLK